MKRNDEEIVAVVINRTAKQKGFEEENLTLDLDLEEDLGYDSVDSVELLLALEDAFDLEDINTDELEGVHTVQDVVDLVKKYLLSI